MRQIKLPDSRNEKLLIHVNGRLYPREEAKISVFDSVVQGGDAVWEGLRVYNGKVFQLHAHLQRLMNSAKAMAFAGIPSADSIKKALAETLQANGMKDETHVRLTLTRGEKVTSGMSPEWNRQGCSLIVLAEWKRPVYNHDGIRLITSSIRRNPPQCIDSKIHHNNLINNILAKIEANLAQADDAVMLDVDGYVSETNATNIFFVRQEKIITPFADSCLPGITRAVILDLCHEKGMDIMEKRVSMTEMYTADEAFVTGTMGEITPVLDIDGRKISEKSGPGPVTLKLQAYYKEKVQREGENIAG